MDLVVARMRFWCSRVFCCQVTSTPLLMMLLLMMIIIIMGKSCYRPSTSHLRFYLRRTTGCGTTPTRTRRSCRGGTTATRYIVYKVSAGATAGAPRLES